MRHYIGGWAVGIVFGLCFISNGEHKPWQVGVLGVLFGVAAWGLL